MRRGPLPAAVLAVLGLTLPGCSLLFVAKGETRYIPSSWKTPPASTSLAGEMEKNPPPQEAPASPAGKARHQVAPGDSLWKLAKHYYGKGAAYPKIASANGLDAEKPIRVGTWLTIFMPGQAEPLPPPGTSTPGTLPAQAAPPPGPRPRVNWAFAPGEKLKFEVRALSVLGGYATLQVGGPVTVAGRACLSLTALANSAFPFSAVYPVEDVQTSYFDAVDFLSWKFENQVHEGGYRAHNLEQYDQLAHRLVRRHNDDQPQTITLPPFAQDIISCFYYFRLLDLQPGRRYTIPTCSSGKNYQLMIDVLGREKVTVPAGTFECLKARPFVKYDTVFRNKEDIVLWVTDDARHLPVKVESAIVIGTISIDLLDATLPEINGKPGP